MSTKESTKHPAELPTPHKGKSGDSWKNLEILQIVVRFNFFLIKIKRIFSVGWINCLFKYDFLYLFSLLLQDAAFFDDSKRPGIRA